MGSMDECISAQVTLEFSTKHWTESRNDPLDLGRDAVVNNALV